jgi:hypothetical protein
MKLLYPLLLWSSSLFAQSPHFVQDLRSDLALACPGQIVHFTAKVAGAETAYLLQENSKWDTLRIVQVNDEIETLSFEIRADSLPLNLRILLKSGSEELLGNAHQVQVSALRFTQHPSDAYQCNGGTALFYGEAVGATAYRWETLDGDTFLPLNESSKFKQVNTPQLRITGLINAHHGMQLRLRASDTHGCQSFSQIAQLHVHQLSTSVSPTTSIPFCAGDSATFFPATVGNMALSYQWLLRKKDSTTWTVLSDTTRYSGFDQRNLRVHAMNENENSYRVKVGFPSIHFPQGTRDSSVCYMESTRLNYTVNAQPLPPVAPDTFYHCGPGKINLEVGQEVHWYASMSAPAALKEAFHFTTDTLKKDSTFFIATLSERGCLSKKVPYPVKIRERPQLILSSSDPLCVNEPYLPVNPLVSTVGPLRLYLDFPDGSKSNVNVQDTMKLPVHSSFTYFVKNEHCSSDTLTHSVPILLPPTIHTALDTVVVCKGDTLRKSISFENAYQVRWFDGNTRIGDAPELLWVADSTTTLKAEVTGACGVLTQEMVYLKVSPPITIASPLLAQEVCEGDTARFKIAAENVEEYLWTLNGSAVGENQSVLAISSAGEIRCTLKNEACSTSTLPIQLRVLPRPKIDSLPSNFVVCDSLPNSHVWLDQEIKPTKNPEHVRFAVQRDSKGCSSLPLPLKVQVQPPFTFTALGSTDRLCAAGNFNRNASIAVISPVPASYELYFGELLVKESTSGKFDVSVPGTYTVKALFGACEAYSNLTFLEEGKEILPHKLEEEIAFCPGEILRLSLDSNSLIWSESGLLLHRGEFFPTPRITTSLHLEISRGEEKDGLFCESPRTPVLLVPKKSAFPLLELYSNSCTFGAKYRSPAGQFIFKDSVNLDDLYLTPGSHTLQFRSPDGCILDTLINTPEPEAPSIQIQPHSLDVCIGNLALFKLNTDAEVQWQVWKDGEFENLEGEQGQNLRISPTTAGHHQQRYRAALHKNHCTIYSDTVLLKLNQVLGSNQSIKLCADDPFTPELPEIIGDYKKAEWYYRAESSGTFLLFPDIYTAQKPEGYYRAKIDFTSGCSISGPTTRLQKAPRPEILGPTKGCLGDTVTISASHCSGPVFWSDGIRTLSRSYILKLKDSLTVSCPSSSCSTPSLPYQVDSLFSTGHSAEIINVTQSRCLGDTLHLEVKNCPTEVLWSDGDRNLFRKIPLTQKITLRARCIEEVCTWSDVLSIDPLPLPEPGVLTEIENAFCSGYNPSNIQNTPAVGPLGYQWQILDSASVWKDLEAATGQNYNPPALSYTTSYRRLAIGICGEVPSNILTFSIKPDPTVHLRASKTDICPDQDIELIAETRGGSGECSLQYEFFHQNSWVSMQQWQTPERDSLIRVRARYTCTGNACNQALSPAIEIRVTAEKKEQIIHVCEGTPVQVPSCKNEGPRYWTASRDSTFVINCPGTCGEFSEKLIVKIFERPDPPINGTSYYQGNPPVWKIQGSQIHWYTTSSGSSGTSSPPNLTKDGIYTFYVSSRNEHCESEKTKVQIEKVSPLEWTSSLGQIIACKGKSTTYSLPIKNATQYLWERKRPEDSIFHPISTNANLSISRSGNEDSPPGTQYRFTVSNGIETWDPILVPYFLNAYEGSLETLKLCRGDSLKISIDGQTKGEVTRYLWQSRLGTGEDWVDLDWPSSPSQTHALPDSLTKAQFRCVIYYTGGCNITTDLMTLTIGEIPPTPEDFYLSFCQNAPTEKYTIPVPEGHRVVWLLSKPDIETDLVQTYSLPFAIENSSSCKSKAAHMHVEIKSLPGPPFNTTPSKAIDSLRFSAEGQQLRWYSSMSAKQGLPYPPFYSTPGKKTHYVTQTVGCESPRLKIESELFAGLSIRTQPRSQANCEGNTVTFTIRATGPEMVYYQWQVLEHGEYKDLPGATAEDLRLSPVSDPLRLRCRVQSGNSVLYSNEVTLGIFKILSSPTPVKLCPGDSLPTDHIQIQGTVNRLEWQIQTGAQYTTVSSSKLSSGRYRARVTFTNGCIRYSDSFPVDTLPSPIFTGFPPSCPENTWNKYSSELPFTVLEEIPDNLPIHKLEGLRFTARNAEGCPLSLPAFLPQYKAVPDSVDPEKTLRIFSLLPQDVWIQKEGNWVNQHRILDTTTLIYATKNVEGCFSNSGLLHVLSIPSYYEKDSTLHFKAGGSYFKGKYYQHSEEGKVFLSADGPIPGGSYESLDTVKNASILPYTLHLQGTPSPLQLHWHVPKKFIGKSIEFLLYTPSVESDWVYTETGIFKNSLDSAFSYVKLPHQKENKYRLLLSPFPSGSLKLLSTTPITLHSTELSTAGEYGVERKVDAGEYVSWKTNIKDHPLLIDLFSVAGKSTYRLTHTLDKRYKTILDSVEVKTENVLCEISGNIHSPGSTVALKTGETEDIILFDASGRHYSFPWQAVGGNQYQIRLPTTLQPGIHFLRAPLVEGKTCIKKLWIK